MIGEGPLEQPLRQEEPWPRLESQLLVGEAIILKERKKRNGLKRKIAKGQAKQYTTRRITNLQRGGQ